MELTPKKYPHPTESNEPKLSKKEMLQSAFGGLFCSEQALEDILNRLETLS